MGQIQSRMARKVSSQLTRYTGPEEGEFVAESLVEEWQTKSEDEDGERREQYPASSLYAERKRTQDEVRDEYDGDYKGRA